MTSLLDKTGRCDAQMLARFAEGIHPSPASDTRCPDARAGGPCRHGDSRVWEHTVLFRELGPDRPLVLQRGPDRRHSYHQQQWQFVPQPFYQISFETSTAFCHQDFTSTPIDSAILWRRRRTAHPPMNPLNPGLTPISQQTCGFAERFEPDGLR